jgi:hypothetical protein
MRLPTLPALVVVLGVAVVLPGCGGSGETFRISDQDITVTSTALPLTLSGQTVNHVIPLSGNCPGPYVMAIISGQLPPGMFLDNATRSIQGVALQTGNYAFRLQIDATGCTPFASTVADFAWVITPGAVAIVLCDPPIIPIAEYNPPNTVIWPDVDGLQTTVYNSFAVHNFTVAGGSPPYVLDLIDDPADPDDGALPLGVAIPPFSTSLVGSPQEVKPGSRTFRLTLRATDSLNATGTRKFQWKIDTPPIVVATTSLSNGKCGTQYSDIIQVAGGVPPFEFEQTVALGDNNSIVWQSPSAPIVNGGAIVVNGSTGRANDKVTAANYPAAATVGPYTSITPEGLVLRETSGSLQGIPRRLGAFTFNVHVFSTLVPNEFGQHAWQQYTVNFANSEPPVLPAPAFSFNAATWTVEATPGLLAASPWSTLPEFEVGVPYNPDGGAAGLSMIAQGGVAKDGLIDAPHFTQLAPNPAEVTGTYDWTINWDADAVGAPNPATGVSLNPATGIISVPNPNLLVGRSRTNISLTASDQQLPTGNRHTINGRAAYSVGPDKVIITESTTSVNTTRQSLLNNDHQMTVRVLRPFSSGMVVTNLANGDLSNTTSLPSGLTPGTTLANLLSTIDILRVTVNPTGYWDDIHGLNSNGARPGQHADPNRDYGYYNPMWQSGGNPQTQQPSVTAVDLPSAPTAVGTTGTGVFKDGGKLYAFQSATRFGVFIIRSDASIAIPCAFDTTSGFSGFGDGLVDVYGANKNSSLRTVQLAVSPDGRFGAMKLKLTTATGHNALLDDAAQTRIVLFSLTGEQVFAGAQFKVITTGSGGGSTTGGIYQYANSLCLTNSHLYYLCGNHTFTYASWKEHLIYRYTITGGAAGGALLSPNAFPRWINNTGSIANMMQTPFQKFEQPTSSNWLRTFNPTTFVMVEVPNDEMYTYEGWNASETAMAPMPFRVSKNGLACAILAGIEPNTTFSTSLMNHDVWVDYSGTLRPLSSTPRHSPGGGGRGYSLTRGPSAYYHWAYRQGPTTRFEISDNALKVAVVVNRQNTSVDAFSQQNWYNFREDIVAFTTTNNWASATEIQVTGTESAATAIFGGSHLWRFGALVFTKDNNGLLFWGGRSAQGSAGNTTQERETCYSGTLYTYDFVSGVYKSILATADGGSDAGVATYTTTSVVNPNAPAGTTLMAHGRVRPSGGFCSKSKDFFYMIALSALSTSSQSQSQILGVNIRTLNNAASINGNPDGLAFKVLGQTTRRGFAWGYHYYNIYYTLEYRYYAPAGANGMGFQVMAKNSGHVFNGSQYQANGPTLDSTSQTSTFTAGSTIASYWGDYGMYGGQVEGFNADIGGPVQRLTTVGLTPVDTTVIRAIHFVEPSADGTAIAFVYDTGGNPRNYNAESLVYMKINWNPTTGAATYRNPQLHTPGSNGRVSDAFSHDSTGNKLYYAFGSGNENAKLLTEMRFNNSATAAPDTITTRTHSTQANYNVLHSGR